jgi:predicted ATPase
MARAHGRQANPPNPLRNRRPYPRPVTGAGPQATAQAAPPAQPGLFTQQAPPPPPDHLLVMGEPPGPTPPPAGSPGPPGSPGTPVGGGFLRSVHMTPAGAAGNPLPLVQALDQIGGMVLDPGVTFLVGENGAGKSTLLAAMAAAAGLEAGLDPLANGVSLNWASSPRTGFVSRGEAPSERFEPGGLYLIDEPEATVSVRGCMALLRDLYDLAWAGAQFFVITHSPLLMAVPGATIWQIDAEGLRQVSYQASDNYQLMADFLANPEQYLRYLFSGGTG